MKKLWTHTGNVGNWFERADIPVPAGGRPFQVSIALSHEKITARYVINFRYFTHTRARMKTHTFVLLSHILPVDLDRGRSGQRILW